MHQTDLLDQLVRAGVHLLELFFFTGAIGSLCVVLISVIGDFRELFQKNAPY